MVPVAAKCGRIVPMSQPAFDFGDEPVDDPTNPTYTVGELADAINDQLRRGFSDGVWVRGEIDEKTLREIAEKLDDAEDGPAGSDEPGDGDVETF